MRKQHPIQRFLMVLVVAGVTLAFTSEAVADTIYLKNGRSIRSSQVRVVGDQVHFLQYGGEVILPMSMVDRIEEDDNVEPAASPPPAEPVVPADPGPDDPAADPDEGVEGQSREDWQERVLSIHAERDEINLQIEDLRRTERAFLFSHRSTAETRQQIDVAERRLAELDQEMTDLQAEARRAGVPAGWLRVPAGAGGGDGVGGADGGGSSGGSGGPGGSGG